MHLHILTFLVPFLAFGLTAALPSPPPSSGFTAKAKRLPTPKHCPLPGPGEDFGTATPEEVNLDPAAVAQAVAYASTHNRISLQIFRHGCLVSTSLLDPLTDSIPNNVWSCTKSVISLLTGIAIGDGKLALSDPVGKYLPAAPGWGDAAHRNLTVLQLLTETAGLREAIISEAATVASETSAPQIALAQPFEHPAGDFFEYTQRVPDLLAYVVQSAVGQDLQAFAQQRLFGPIGIAQDSYFWLRDRSGNTYGYAWLFMAPAQLARLGLLTQYGGAWNGQRVVPADYIAGAATPSEKNPCYGWLFWNNAGSPCTGANIPAAQTLDRTAIPAAPHDLFAMVGALQQNNFLIPSIDMTVTWSGVLGDYAINLSELLSATPGPLYNNFFSLLMPGVLDATVPHVGFLPADPLDLDITPTNYFNPSILLSNINTNPQCNVIVCDGKIPTTGLLQNVGAILAVLVGKLQDIACMIQ